MKQRSSEWFQVRCGRITGSRFAAVMASSKTVAYCRLIDELVREREGSQSIKLPITAPMQWGIDHEDEAREWYTRATRNDVDLVGFVHHPRLDFVGVSPDGLVGARGVLEIKCPQLKAYQAFALERRIPSRYAWQVQGQLWVCDRVFAHFMCFYPGAGGCIVRVERDEDMIRRLHQRCLEVEHEVQARVQTNRSRVVLAGGQESGMTLHSKRRVLAGHLRIPWWIWAIAAVLAWVTLFH